MFAENNFEALLHALPEPVVILTPDLLVRHSNAAFLSATGVTEIELLDRHLINEVFPDLDDRGSLSFIVHRVQDVTVARTSRAVAASSKAPGEPARSDDADGEPADNAEELRPTAELDGQFDEQLDLLRRVVDARAIIEQAKGMLMAEHRMSAEGAFDLLRAKSQNSNVKLRDIAAHHVLLHSGRFTVSGTTQRR